MVDINRIDREAFQDTWDQIISVLHSMESEKAALKSLKSDLGTIIGADSSKEANAIIKALLKKESDGTYYDEDTVDSATELYEEFIGGGSCSECTV